MEVIYKRPQRLNDPAWVAIRQAIDLQIKTAKEKGDQKELERLNSYYESLDADDVVTENTIELSNGELRSSFIARNKGFGRFDMVVEHVDIEDVLEMLLPDIINSPVEQIDDQYLTNLIVDQPRFIKTDIDDSEYSFICRNMAQLDQVLPMLGYPVFDKLDFDQSEATVDTLFCGKLIGSYPGIDNFIIPVYCVEEYRKAKGLSPQRLGVTITSNDKGETIANFLYDCPDVDMGAVTWELNSYSSVNATPFTAPPKLVYPDPADRRKASAVLRINAIDNQTPVAITMTATVNGDRYTVSETYTGRSLNMRFLNAGEFGNDMQIAYVIEVGEDKALVNEVTCEIRAIDGGIPGDWKQLPESVIFSVVEQGNYLSSVQNPDPVMDYEYRMSSTLYLEGIPHSSSTVITSGTFIKSDKMSLASYNGRSGENLILGMEVELSLNEFNYTYTPEDIKVSTIDDNDFTVDPGWGGTFSVSIPYDVIKDRVGEIITATCNYGGTSLSFDYVVPEFSDLELELGEAIMPTTFVYNLPVGYILPISPLYFYSADNQGWPVGSVAYDPDEKINKLMFTNNIPRKDKIHPPGVKGGIITYFNVPAIPAKSVQENEHPVVPEEKE